MDQYTHPSRRTQHNGNGSSLSPPRSNENMDQDANAGVGGGPGTPLTLKTGDQESIQPFVRYDQSVIVSFLQPNPTNPSYYFELI